MRDTLSVLFAGNNRGVDSFVWWGYNTDGDALGQRVNAELIDSMIGAHAVETTPGLKAKGNSLGEPLFQAHANGNSQTWVTKPAQPKCSGRWPGKHRRCGHLHVEPNHSQATHHSR